MKQKEIVITQTVRFEIFKRDGFKCVYCGVKPSEKEIHVEHVVPKSRGGFDVMKNLVTSCRTCNIGKSNILLNETAEEWSYKKSERKLHLKNKRIAIGEKLTFKLKMLSLYSKRSLMETLEDYINSELVKHGWNEEMIKDSDNRFLKSREEFKRRNLSIPE